MAWSDNFISGDDFDSIRLSVAKKEDILFWSYGEVLKPETINYRTQKPERDGLFCERIFGPVKDINPNDIKLKGIRSREAAVDKEGNLVTKSITRRERMGHITLATPVTHIWFTKGVPSALSMLLDLTVKNIEKVIYFMSYIITDAKTEQIEQTLADLENTHDAAKLAIKVRYDELEKDKKANIEALAEEKAKEEEALEVDYLARKNTLTSLKKGAIISDLDYRALDEAYEELITVDMGAKSIKTLLEQIDLGEMIKGLAEEAEKAKGQKAKKLMKRLKLLESMHSAGIKPTDLILEVIPVIPPDLRPMISIAGGRFATSDLNDLYRRIINRNNRLKKLIELNAPEVIQRNEKRMLQEAVDALIDNSSASTSRAANAAGNRRRLKSLSDMLKGKQGRFRQNLLGKRVDYSGRSVIVVGPELSLNECGIPKQMALELFKPFVISWLISEEKANNIRSATRLIEASEPIVWDALDEVIEDKYVLLNRAPSLHRLSIRAFTVKLIDGKAIQLHPLVAKGFNADYDGDQMAVHLPLSAEAQAEAAQLISIENNLFKPSNGRPILSIEQDIILGNYYLTYDKPSLKDQEPKPFTSVYEAEIAYHQGLIELQTPIRVHTKSEKRNTTLGRVFFNEILPKDYPYDNSVQTKKQLNKVLANVFDLFGAEATVEVADKIKDLSFQYETIASISISKDDYPTYPEVDDIIAEGDAKTALISEQFEQGVLTEKERYQLTVANWREVDQKIQKLVESSMAGVDTNISMMINSGARGSVDNVRMASAEIGVQLDINNREIELPVKSNFSKGVSTLEAFIVTRGARQGQVSTALRTADSGYLTRRLVDVSQDIFTIEGEFEDPGYEIRRSEAEELGITFGSRLAGRFAAEDVDGYVKKDELISQDIANAINDDEEVKNVKIYSILSTKCEQGVPIKAYGIDMASHKLVRSAEPVGVIAAQSIGEPGTQLTLDTKHGSGAAGSGNIARGLPRVEELLEARDPKGRAFIATVDGIVEIHEAPTFNTVIITPSAGKTEKFKLDGQKVKIKDGASIKAGDVLASKAKGESPIIAPFDGNVQLEEEKIILVAKTDAAQKTDIPKSYKLTIKAGDVVEAGDRLTEGSLNLQDLMKYKGIEATERYIINEILSVYSAQGHEIGDKHLEIIVRQMFSRVIVDDPGDSDFIIGSITSQTSALEENKRLEAAGKNKIIFTKLLLGISKVSIKSDSFLSAASFQDTTRVLIDAALQGKVDHLKGLKENVIIGRKIPVGTGINPIIVPETEKTPLPAQDFPTTDETVVA